MATLILLNKTELPKGTPSEALVAVWDKGSVPDGQISIPVELNERLLPIRDDLAAWTYETGCARINGKLLEEHLRADDNLSMWWCSTLVEKHPKVTHNLFPALKLRALELLLDEKGVTRLELCVAAGADPWMEDVLGRFCKATGREFAVFNRRLELSGNALIVGDFFDFHYGLLFSLKYGYLLQSIIVLFWLPS